MYALIANSKQWPISPVPPFYTQHTEIVQLLLDAGADVDAQSKDGWTALMVAARYRSARFVRVLLDAGTNNCGVIDILHALVGVHGLG